MLALYSGTKLSKKSQTHQICEDPGNTTVRKDPMNHKIKGKKGFKDQKSNKGHISICQAKSNMVTIPVAESYVPSYLTVQQYHQETSHHCIVTMGNESEQQAGCPTRQVGIYP